ncbi:MAG: GWxTD domain-containing protein [Gemmatimonadota bacterium]
MLEGRPLGGPLAFRGLAAGVALAGAFVAGACGGGTIERTLDAAAVGPAARPLAVYSRLGFLAGPAHFPVVASFATVAGPADSTYVLFAMSLPNSALRFQREERSFAARYEVSLVFRRDSVEVRRSEREETVRIPAFAETARTEESVVFQDLVALAPGTYEVTVVAGDRNSSRGFDALDTLEVPAYGAGATVLTLPVSVYAAEPRADRAAHPRLLVNPRRTVPYGAEAPRLYVEWYGTPAADSVGVRVLDEEGQPIWRGTSALSVDEGAVRHALITVDADALPLGRHTAEVFPHGVAGNQASAPLLLTISDQWMVANFEEVLEFLRFIGTNEELDSLQAGTPAERRERWEEFWRIRDPLPATPLNEYREEFFERVRVAAELFGESGRPGWRTDRGEVYIVLGPPDESYERFSDRDMGARPDVIEWSYLRVGPGGGVRLIFYDRSGLGRFELTPESEMEFRRAAERLKPRR